MTNPLQKLLENINITEAERIKSEKVEIVLSFYQLMNWLRGEL